MKLLITLSTLATLSGSLFAGSICESYSECYQKAIAAKKPMIVAFVDHPDVIRSFLEKNESALGDRLVAVVDAREGAPEATLSTYFSTQFVTGKGILELSYSNGSMIPQKSAVTEESAIFEEKLAVIFGLYRPVTNLIGTSSLRQLAWLLPRIDNEKLLADMFSTRSIWYDHLSVPLAYQDGVPPFTGIRPNSSRLSLQFSNFFDGNNFPAPLDKTGGTSSTNQVRTVNALILPVDESGRMRPIVYRMAQIGAYHGGQYLTWTYPEGTQFVEVLLQRLDDGQELVFEIRHVKKLGKEWAPEVYRVADTSETIARLVEELPSQLANESQKAKLSEEILSNQNLQPESLSDRYGIVRTRGLRKHLPAMHQGILRHILANTFRAVAGVSYQSTNHSSCYCPTGPALGGNSIYPRNYQAGALPVDTASCAQCHNRTEQALEHFDQQMALYGQVWGADQRFSFHPFRLDVVSDYGEYGQGGYTAEQVVRTDFISAGIFARYQPGLHPQAIYQSSTR